MFYNILRKEPTESHRFLCHRVIKNKQLQFFRKIDFLISKYYDFCIFTHLLLCTRMHTRKRARMRVHSASV